MARSRLTVELIGHAGADATLHYGPSCSATSVVRVAVDEPHRDPQDKTLKARTVWHRIVFFGDVAHRAHRLIYAGREVMITASMRYRTVEDRDGHQHRVVDLVGQDFDAFGEARNASQPLSDATYHLLVDPSIGF